jgi:hypothetical protein
MALTQRKAILVKRTKRKNFLGFGKKTTHSPALLQDAYAAGRKSGDTSEFESWLKRQKPEELHGSFKRKLKDRYNSGVHSLWAEEKQTAKKEKIDKQREAKRKESEVEEDVISALVNLGMKSREAKILVRRKYRSGDGLQ